jgi:hypothetical protein
MALVTCAGFDVLRMRLHMTQRRAWFGWFDLDTDTLPSGTVQIKAAGGLSLTGTVTEPSGVFLDSAHVRVVGGAGGLDTIVGPAAYEYAQLGDPLRAVLGAAGETLSSTVSPIVMSVLLTKWTITATFAARALDELAAAATIALGKPVIWRVVSDGSIWLGVEEWPALKMPAGADILETEPAEGRYVIGTETPFLAPGVNLDGVGHVVGADHWVSPSRVRTDAWI